MLYTLIPKDWLLVPSWARKGPSMNPKIFSEPSHYLCVLSSGATRDGGLLCFLHLGMAKSYQGRIKVCFKLKQKKICIHTKKFHFGRFLSCLWLSMTFWASFQGNGWEISHLKAEAGTYCPIIPSLRSRDMVTLALPRCQTVTQVLKLRLWHQKTGSFFSLSPSCGNPCNRHQGQLPNTEMTSTQAAILMLCGSIGGFFIYSILWHRFRRCFWKLNFKSCSPALATNVGIHKYLLNKCLFLHN